MNRSLGFVLLALASSALGCSSSSPGYAGSTRLETGKAYWVAYDSNRRGGFVVVDQFKDAKGNDLPTSIRSCSEPPPDSVGTVDQGLGAKGGAQGAEGALDLKNKTDVVVLSKRSEDLELLRESYFRLCELSLREGWNAKMLNDQYGLVLGVYKQVVANRTAAECFKAAAANPTLADKFKCEVFANLGGPSNELASVVPPGPSPPKEVAPAPKPRVSEGECKSRCDTLCSRHRGTPAEPHFCSDGGAGRRSCLIGDAPENWPRCNDAGFLAQ